MLELLIVLALLSVIVGMAGLSLGRDGKRLAAQEAGLFVQLVQHVRQQAVLQGRPAGVRVDRGGYQLMQQTASGWTAVGTAHATGLSLRLELDDVPVSLQAHSARPQVIANSNDEYTAFTLHFEQAGVRLATVMSDGLNDPWLDR
ncbi:hypothetical protein PspTeo4_32104 [Pseudomonas sp. Teo4]|nr:hypothetical protein [Pseudomonas sp. Teo4]